MPTFQTEDLLTFLCVHGGKHGWPTLIGICDVARLMARCPVDWDLTMSRAEEMSVSRYLRLGIRLAVDVLGCEAPREVWRCIEADAVVERLAEKIRANLHGRHSFTLAELLGLQFRLLTSPADKLRIIGHYLGGPTTAIGRHSGSLLPCSRYITSSDHSVSFATGESAARPEGPCSARRWRRPARAAARAIAPP